MSIMLSNYRPFDCTKALFEWQSSHLKGGTCLQIAKSVAVVALTVLATLPAVLIDFVLSPAILAYRLCYPTPRLIASPPPQRQVENVPRPPAPPVIQMPRPAQEGRVPDAALIRSLLASPPSHLGIDNPRFLRNSLQAAFRQNRPETVAIYKQLIENEGVLAGEGEPPIEIYKWTAGCLLAHYLIAKSQSYNFVRQLYPERHPLRDEAQGGEAARQHERAVADLVQTFRLDTLQQKDRAAALLQIMVPSVQWELSDASKGLVNAINAVAIAMTQNQSFRDIYTPATEDVGNI